MLVAEDDSTSRRILTAGLVRAGWDVIPVEDGDAAWRVLESAGAPSLALLDWMMPGLDGVEVCRRLRARAGSRYTYVILVTSRTRKEDLVEGFAAGVDDFVRKPYDADELDARLRVGQRIVDLETGLDTKVRELEDALGHVKTLQGLIPICMHCKNVRRDADTWQRVEAYVQENSEAVFTHSLCDSCMDLHYPDDRSTPAAQTSTEAPVKKQG